MEDGKSMQCYGKNNGPAKYVMKSQVGRGADGRPQGSETYSIYIGTSKDNKIHGLSIEVCTDSINISICRDDHTLMYAKCLAN